MTGNKRVLIIAGPNGAGKSTFAHEYLPNEAQCPVFVNSDLIAAGLSPFDPAKAAVRAGRLMLQEMERHARENTSFAFETTLSGVMYARRVPRWQQAGYRIELLFLWLHSVELAIERVAIRVRQGGHAFSERIIRRRYHAGWSNSQNHYKPMVDAWVLYDNSGTSPQLMDQGAKT